MVPDFENCKGGRKKIPVLIDFLKIIKICEDKNGGRGSLKKPLINLLSLTLIFIQIFDKGPLNNVNVTNKKCLE